MSLYGGVPIISFSGPGIIQPSSSPSWIDLNPSRSRLIKEYDRSFAAEAEAQGWRDNGNGYWSRFYNGVSQTLPAGMVASNLNEQKMATALSQPVPVGGNYLSQIQSLLGQSPATDPATYDNPYERRLLEIMNDPDKIANTNAYKFRFNQGQQALERSAAARGMLNSGNTLAALADYGQGLASQEYGNEFNRLSQAVGQRNQFNLGKAGLTSQDRNSQAGIALKALGDYDQTRITAQKVAAENARNLGRINPGDRFRTSTW